MRQQILNLFTTPRDMSWEDILLNIVLAAVSSRVKPHNEKVYYIIDNIQTAIGNHQLSQTACSVVK